MVLLQLLKISMVKRFQFVCLFCSNCRISVHIFNMTAKIVESRQKSVLYGHSWVKVVHHGDRFNNAAWSKWVCWNKSFDDERNKLGMKIDQGLAGDIRPDLYRLSNKWTHRHIQETSKYVEIHSIHVRRNMQHTCT